MPNCVLLDIGGVITVGDEMISGAADALQRLRDGGCQVRFLTNTSRRPVRLVLQALRKLGVHIERDELFTPAMAASRFLEERKLKPTWLIHPALREDVGEDYGDEATAVVVGDAGDAFTYERLNNAFRLLDKGAVLVALARNRTFRDGDKQLSLDAGPFIRALEYACGRAAEVVGKPSPDFFRLALESARTPPDRAVMIGDDVEADIGGAIAVGMPGLLVKTGKYRSGDEARIKPSPTRVCDDLSAAVTWLLTAGTLS